MRKFNETFLFETRKVGFFSSVESFAQFHFPAKKFEFRNPIKSTFLLKRLFSPQNEFGVDQGCQMLYFQTKKPICENSRGPGNGKGWYIIHMEIWHILRPFGIYHGHLVI
jgi:hypothetical protein